MEMKRIKEVLKHFFTDEEIERIENFLKGFGIDGQEEIAKIFVHAAEEEISVDDIFVELEKEWETTWQRQFPEDRGNTNFPWEQAEKNKKAIERVRESLGI